MAGEWFAPDGRITPFGWLYIFFEKNMGTSCPPWFRCNALPMPMLEASTIECAVAVLLTSISFILVKDLSCSGFRCTLLTSPEVMDTSGAILAPSLITTWA